MTTREYLKRYVHNLVTGPVSLLKGLSVTMRYFFSPSKVVTEQYPENRATLKMHPRFRGSVELIHDQNDEHTCTACSICEKACPNGSISILATKNLAGKRVLGRYIYRLDTCTQCNLCIESCPFGSIRMNQEFELSSTSKEGFTMILNKKEGRG